MNHRGKRRCRGRAIFLAAFLGIFAGFLSLAAGRTDTAFAAGKRKLPARPEYLKSVTYFGDEWPINYWSSEDRYMEENMERIVEDGFNSIILVVPWRQFQPGTLSENFNETAFARLNEVMDCAADYGLWVSLRIGYSWDYYGGPELPERFQDIFYEGSEDRKLWLAYAEKIYETASTHENFYGAFITWEDFWEFSYSISRELSVSRRTTRAANCGYQKYLAENYTMEEVNQWYGQEFERFSQTYIPNSTQPAAALFYEFYDAALTKLLKETQEVFPGLSMEVRTDGDRVLTQDGETAYYSHESTYPCDGASYTAIMYSVSMGQQNKGDTITAAKALASTREKLTDTYLKSGKKLYVEQFLYADSTEFVSMNTKVEPTELGDYVRSVAPVFRDTTMGYGLWVYRNYVNNCVNNGQFAYGKDSWEFVGQSRVEEQEGTPMAFIEGNSTISQKLVGRMQDGPEIHVQLYAKSKGDYTTSITVEIGNTRKSIRITEPGIYTVTVPWTENYDLKLSSPQGAYVDDIKVYSYLQEGQIYDVNGEALHLADDFRSLNGQLP